MARCLFVGDNNNGLNGNNNLNNNGRVLGIVKLTNAGTPTLMENTVTTLYSDLCSYKNLEHAFMKARKRKTLKPYVIEFEKNLKENLLNLQTELTFHTYKPRPLKTFILHDPKTRKISKADFRDRVIHHAICNIIETTFDKTFIYDNYANRKRKGTFKAIQRFEYYKRKVSKNNTRICYVLKADIKHYFDTVDHQILLSLLSKRIQDERILWLINQILKNHHVEREGKGMPLGNLTSQFLANVYLNELDQYVKHELKARYYVRYVDDFIILSDSKLVLEEYKVKINEFLIAKLNLELHPNKCKILTLNNGVGFLGFRIFYYHKLVRKKNLNKFARKLEQFKDLYKLGKVSREKVLESFEGWLAYLQHANTYKYRRHITRLLNQYFPTQPTIRVDKVKQHERSIKRAENSQFEYSSQKTLQLYKRGLNIKKIAEQRGIKESTAWEHFAKLIEHNQYSVWKLLPKEKILKILPKINCDSDQLKYIKQRINDDTITYDEINLVLASVKAKNREKNVAFHVNWYKKNHCYRKCYFNPDQRKMCSQKFDQFISTNPNLKMKKQSFVDLFNNHMNICVLPEQEKRRYITWKEFASKIKKVLE